MKSFKSAFTMIELVFVIVVLGILAAVAVPKLAATRDDAVLTRIKSDYNSITSGIALVKNENMLAGVFEFPSLGENFSNVLSKKVSSKDWKLTGGTWDGDTTTVKTCIKGKKCAEFTYTKEDGKFDCDPSNDVCKLIIY